MNRIVLSVMMLGCVAGCAKHSDFIEMKEEMGTLIKVQDQTQKRQDAIQRRLQALESGKPIQLEDGSKSQDGMAPRLQELTMRLSELEGRLARIEDNTAAQNSGAMKSDEAFRPPKSTRLPESQDTGAFLPGTPAITPTSAFNLAYNDYLNGRYELAVTGFQRFLKDFPSTSLAPNAYYWTGESYFSLKDYGRAMQAFQRVISDHPRSEKIPPALFKLGLTAAEMGDTPKARGYLKRVIEEFSTSDEAKLAKNKLAEIR